MTNPLSARYPSLAGKRVVITGGGSGIGEGIVRAFVAQAAEVHFLDVADEPARALEAGLAGAASAPRFHH